MSAQSCDKDPSFVEEYSFDPETLTIRSKWSFNSIKINGGQGKPKIDIMKCLTNPEHDRDINLPPDVYPADENGKGKELLIAEITRSALEQASTNLQVRQNKKDYFQLICKHGRKTHSKKKQSVLDSSSSSSADYQPEVREGVKKSYVVGKAKSVRQNGKAAPRRAESQRPSSHNNLCKFKISARRVGNIWQLFGGTEETLTHSNHVRLKKNELTCSSKILSKEEKENVSVLSQVGHSATTQAFMQHQMNGIMLSKDQVRHVTEQQRNQEKPLNPASDFVKSLQDSSNKEGLRYILLFHEVTDSSLVAINKAKVKKERESRRKTVAAAEAMLDLSQPPHDDGPQHPKDDDTEQINDLKIDVTAHGTDKQTKHSFNLSTETEKLELGETLMNIKDRLKVGDKVFIAGAWSRQDERLLFEQYPEILMVDVTFDTNNEHRPLAVTSGTDGNMNIFIPVRSFLPSQCRWVFDWLFSVAIPKLLGAEPLKRTQLVLTDGDSKEYGAFDAAQERHYPNAKHGLCCYHLVTQPLQKLAHQRLLNSSDQENRDLVLTVKHWVFSWMRLGGVENEMEFKISHDQLRAYLYAISTDTDKKYSQSMRHNAGELDAFVTRSLMDTTIKRRWALYERAELNLMYFDQCTTSALEGGVNSVMKSKSSKKVLPSMSLRRSFETMQVQANTRMSNMSKKNAQSLGAHPLWVKGSKTALQVNTVGESIIQQCLGERSNYALELQPCHTLIYVARLPGTTSSFCASCSVTSTCPACSKNSPITKFKNRLREVKLTPCDGSDEKFVLTCSCLWHRTIGLPCVHMCCILPTVTWAHVHVRWLRAYAVLYKRKGFEEITKYFQERQKDRRLVIDLQERNKILSYAKGKHSVPGSEHIASILKSASKIVPVQNNPEGMIVYERAPATGFSSFDGAGLLSQEVGGVCSSDEEEQPVDAPYRSGNEYNDMIASFQQQWSNAGSMPAEAKQQIVKNFYLMIHENNNLIREHVKPTSTATAGDYISSHLGTDKRRKGKRIRAAHEYSSNPKKNQKNT